MSRRLRLRTVLILVNLIVLALPLAGIQVLRIYESALVRQTESELIAQGAAIASFYRATFARLTELPGALAPGADDVLMEHSSPGPAAPSDTGTDAEEPWRPRPAELDLATSRVSPPPSDPVPGRGADPLATVVGDTLVPVLEELQRVTLAAIRVTDFRGVIVASTGADRGDSLAHVGELRAALGGAGESRLRERALAGESPPLSSISRGSRIRVFVSTPIVLDGRILGAVLLSRTPADIVQALYGKRTLLLQGSALLLLAVVGIGYLTSRTIVTPLKELSASAAQIARGEVMALERLRPSGTREIAQLGQSVHAMGDTLQRRADYLRDFARHLSHEFKTPLAAIRGAVEVLEDHDSAMDDTRRRGFLANIHADVDRLNDLTGRLLELTRAEMSTPEPGASTDLAALAGMLQDDYGVVVAGATAPLRVAIDADRLRAVLCQLIDNARQHGGADVGLRLDIANAGTDAELVFRDDGPGISAGNREHVFEPFFTTARANGGTGLGLSIARAMLQGAGGNIVLEEGVAHGTVFRIRIPLAAG